MSQTSICNLALLRIGIAQSIADITEASAAARACRAVYTHCLTTMLRERPWPFAVRQVELVVVTEQTFGEWLYSYRYPSNFVNLHRLLTTSTVSDTVIYTTPTVPATKIPYAIGSDAQGRLVHTNLYAASAIGTELVTDVALFDPMFSSALSWFIASEIALSLTKNREIGQEAKMEYERIVSEAVATAHNEVKPEISNESGLIEARL